MDKDDFPSLGKAYPSNDLKFRKSNSYLKYSDKLKSNQNKNSYEKGDNTNIVKSTSTYSHHESTITHSPSKSNSHMRVKDVKALSNVPNVSKNCTPQTKREFLETEENNSNWIKVIKNSKKSDHSKTIQKSHNDPMVRGESISLETQDFRKNKRDHGSVFRSNSDKFQNTAVKNTKLTSSPLKSSLKKTDSSSNIDKSASLSKNHSMSMQDSKSNNLTSENTEVKKKKRKSKVKRQAAMQSTKLTVLTPEAHSRILSKTSNVNTQYPKNISYNINDDEEYPELGAIIDVKHKKQPNRNIKLSLNKNYAAVLHEQNQVLELNSVSEDNSVNQKDILKDSSNADAVPIVIEETKEVEEKKHVGDPITMSLFDIIQSAKTKRRDPEKRIEETNYYKSSKAKKMISPAVNPLDSSRPSVKRGKEREKPKVKKPSRMKKLILLERQIKKHSSTNLEHNENDFLLEDMVSDCESDDFVDSIKALFFIARNMEDYVSNIDMDKNHNKTEIQESCSNAYSSPDKKNNCVCPVNSDKHSSKYESSSDDAEKIGVFENKFGKNETDVPNTEMTKSLQSMFSSDEKRKAAQLIIHTRKFRQYCNQFLSKEIDEAVFSLIDDLARFQDRLHLKDPVKARIRRRLVYGIKEIKRHMKMKKLKCIIIASDIEDIKTEGGLNDTIEEIKSLSEAYHVPCVFSHQRYSLGKVCRKSVPVSCVGVFNYEGSEKNFKRMIELKADNKHDYAEFTKKLASDLTDDQCAEVFRVEKMSNDVLRATSQNILRELYFLHLKEKSNTQSSKKVGATSSLDENSEISSKLDIHATSKNDVTKVQENRQSILCDTSTLRSENDFNSGKTVEKLNIGDILYKYKVLKD